MLAAFVVAAALTSGAVADDAELTEALERLYDGSTDSALERLAALAAEAPDDPVPVYFGALALCWKAEQQPESKSLDAEVHRRATASIAIADAQLAKNPRAARARLARGAAWGVKSRLQLFRRERRDALRSAVRMREELSRAHALDPDDKDALFGLGLYDYYAGVLPRFAKLLRLFAGDPRGDRPRGLARIEQARHGSRWHGTEVEAQRYEIYAYYENDPQLALQAICGLRERYPGSPLWALKLAEHLRERLRHYPESAAVAGEILAASEAGQENYSPVVGAMARLALGRALQASGDVEGAAQQYKKVLEVRDGPEALRSDAEACLSSTQTRGVRVADPDRHSK